MSDEVRKLAEQVAAVAPLTSENFRERMLDWLAEELSDGAPAAVFLCVQRQEGKDLVRGASQMSGRMTAMTAQAALAAAGRHVARFMAKHACRCQDCEQVREVARLAWGLSGEDAGSS